MKKNYDKNEKGQIKATWNSEPLGVKYRFRGKHRRDLYIKVASRGIATETTLAQMCGVSVEDQRRLADAIIEASRKGYSVTWFNMWWTAHLFNQNTDKIEVVVHSKDELRHSCEDAPVTFKRKGEEVSLGRFSVERADQKRCFNETREKERAMVSPDTVVTCPNCGTEFRVGRKLTDGKEKTNNED